MLIPSPSADTANPGRIRRSTGWFSTGAYDRKRRAGAGFRVVTSGPVVLISRFLLGTASGGGLSGPG
jgi:hypothetical protein